MRTPSKQSCGRNREGGRLDIDTGHTAKASVRQAGESRRISAFWSTGSGQGA